MATKITEKIKQIRRRRRRLSEVKAQQKSVLQSSTPDLGATGRLLRFGAQQRDVISRELTPAQRRTLKRRKFSATPLPTGRGGRVSADLGSRNMAAAIGGGRHVPKKSQGRPKTQINLKNTRGQSNILLRSLARHEVGHQLTSTNTQTQHQQFNLLGGTGGSTKRGRAFFRGFQRLNPPKKRKIVRVDP